MRAMPWLWAALVFTLALATQAYAAPLTITKTSQVVSDPVGNLLPKRVPGSVVDYTVSIANPLANSLTTVDGFAFSDAIPANTELSVADLGLLNAGPVVFTNSLVPSGLGYSFSSLGSTTDSLEFSSDNGATWLYKPVPNGGYDPKITNIRVRLSGSQAAGTTVSLRFRVRVR